MKIDKNYIDGKWIFSGNSDQQWTRENPSKISETLFRAYEDLTHVDLAVDAATRAFPIWRDLGEEKRREYLIKLQAEFRKKESKLANQIALEAGKPLWEAMGEAKALSAKIDIMTSDGAALVKSVTPTNLNGRYRFRPLGPITVLGPFNFPAHLPNGHIIPALLHGNTIVVKASEMSSGVMALYFECIEEAGFPPGVINLLQGGGKTGAALVAHPNIRGVFFTGSWNTGLAIRRATLESPYKTLALEMGGKNTSIILPDANLEQAVHEVLLASFLTTGQRCSATSRLVIMDEVYDQFVERFRELTKKITSGDVLSADAFMGPLNNSKSFDYFLESQKNDESGKLRNILCGGPTENKDGYFVSPALWEATEVDPKGTHQSEEIFGPDVVIYRASSDQQAMEIANATEFGLAMAVFTKDRERFDRFADLLDAGIVNLNRSTVGASSKLPFGGVKKSGNRMPSALFAPYYCTYPQAQLFEDAGWTETQSRAGALGKLGI